MKPSLLSRIPLVGRLIGPSGPNNPLLKNSSVSSEGIYYSQAELASGAVRCPTQLLYPQIPTTAGDIIGKGIGAPLYDNIGAAVRRLTRRFRRTPDTLGASAQQFVGTAPTNGNKRLTTKDALAAAAIASTGMMTCAAGGADGDLTSVLTKAILFNLVGGLGLFLYGMKLMDDGLKSASGSTMKKVISTLTGNRFAALAVGAGVVSVIQSSSVATVITLGLVDAGLMNLTQALGIVAGANIGTTMTGWLFAVKVSEYGLPLLGASAFTNLIAKNEKVKSISKGTLGLGMVFLGLTTMSAGFKDPIIKTHLTDLFSSLNGTSIWDIGTCILIGTGITAGIQSSSATLGITIALAKAGIIPYETAVGLVLGSNIGTTITAWLAAGRPGTSTAAKRVAIAHSLFNIFGVMAIWPWSPAFAEYSKRLAIQMGFSDPGVQVAFVHTFFNVAASAAFLATLNPFERLVTRLAPEKAPTITDEDEAIGEVGYGRGRLSHALLSAKVPGIALSASQGVIASDVNPRVEGMFRDALAIMSGKPLTEEIEQRMRQYEADLDLYEESLGEWLFELSLHSLNQNDAVTRRIQHYTTEQLESISDHLLNLFLHYKKPAHQALPPNARELIAKIQQDIFKHFSVVSRAVVSGKPIDDKDLIKIIARNDRLKDLVTVGEKFDLELDPEEMSARNIIKARGFFRDFMPLFRSILGHIKNIAEALAGEKK